jgi:primosomal protein N'
MSVRQRPVLDSTVEVFCEQTGRLGTLSYLIPAGLTVRVGDAVRVPFGTGERRGVVVGEGDGTKATKALLEVFGPRTNVAEIDLALEVARVHAVPFTQVASRLAPRSKRGNPPLDTGPLELATGERFADWGFEPGLHQRLVVACAPLVSLERFAACEAARLVEAASADGRSGQVLVVCPTKSSVGRVTAQFVSGAARLDTTPAGNDPSPWHGFVSGSVRVAVGTRSSVLWAAADLAGIVVVDEAHPGHVEASQPHTNAGLLAAERAARAGVPLTLVSQVPTAAALGAKVKCVTAGGRNRFARARLVDRSDAAPGRKLIPPALFAALRSDSLPVLVVAPGRSPKFRCLGCKAQGGEPVCSMCGSSQHVRTSLDPVGVVERFAAVGLTVESCSVHELLAAPLSRRATRVVVLDVDGLESFAEMYPGQTASRVVYAAHQRAGLAGEVVVVSEVEPSAVVRHLVVRPDLKALSKWRWEDARSAGLPPFVSVATIETRRVKAPRRPDVGRVFGPRLRDDGEWELRVLFAPEQLDRIHAYVNALRRGGKVRVSFA